MNFINETNHLSLDISMKQLSRAAMLCLTIRYNVEDITHRKSKC